MHEFTDYERAVGLAARRLISGVTSPPYVLAKAPTGGIYLAPTETHQSEPTGYELAVGFAYRLLEVAFQPVVVRPDAGVITPKTTRGFGLPLRTFVRFERMTAKELALELSTCAGEIQVREHLDDLIAAGSAIEGEALRAFAREAVMGRKLLPRRKGEPQNYQEHARKRAIKKSVAHIVGRGWLLRTRNESSPDHSSACDAVACAATLLGEPMTCEQVRKIVDRA